MSTKPEGWGASSSCCGTSNQFRPLQSQSAHDEVEAILVQGMKDLTFQELQREQEDLHGVAPGCIIESGTVVLNQLLQSLKYHLGRIKQGTAFESAELRNPSYVHRRDFQIIFLRANRNNPKAAAEQMIKYFNLKQRLFGDEALVRDITSQDLNYESTRSMMSGNAQVGSVPDRAGRVIVWAFPSLRTGASALDEIRGMFYLGMNMLQSLEDPGKGIIIVSYQVGDFREKTNPNFGEAIEATQAMPYNIAGYHFCFDSRSAAFLAKTAVAVMPAHLRVKTRIHYGSHQECQYLMSGYGIPREALPFTSNNEYDPTFHTFWFHQCIEKEQKLTNQTPDSSTSQSNNARNSKAKNKHIDFLSSIWKGETPMENDVLCVGRKVNGKGNERLMSLAMTHADAYDAATPIERRIILNTIMEEIRSHGGRFLKLDTMNDKGWVTVGDAEMREKICQTFRNFRYRRVSRQSKGNGADSRNGSKPKGASASTGVVVSSDESASGGASSAPAVIVDEHRAADVLFGKLKDHEGNQYLRELVEGMAAQYDTANRGEKSKLADQIMAKVRERGGRFLKPVDDGRWEVVSDKDAAKKIGHHFRNLRRKQWR